MILAAAQVGVVGGEGASKAKFRGAGSGAPEEVFAEGGKQARTLAYADPGFGRFNVIWFVRPGTPCKWGQSGKVLIGETRHTFFFPK